MEDSTSFAAIIFGFITAIGVIYAILRGVSSDIKDRNQNFAKMLAEFDNELSLVLEKEKELETGKPNKARCDRIASDYLNILDRIAFLRQKKKIDDDMIFYFDNYFAYGKLFINWKFRVHQDEKNTKERFHNHIWWTENSLNKYRLKDYDMEQFLPPDMWELYQHIPKVTSNPTHGTMPKDWKSQ